jgi:2-methylisocitrate lyase-like PEP mutase family enzyme
MPATQAQRAIQFQALHRQSGLFIMPNPWDAGSARLLASLGFEALGSTSAGGAATLGVADYALTRDALLTQLATLATATDLPLSADLEDGYGDTPDAVAETIRAAAAVGAVGGSIEDIDRSGRHLCLPLAEAAERVRAAAEAAHALPFPFTLTARAENFMLGHPDLADTIARLQAYQDAGADVLYAPAVKHSADLRSILANIDRPLNVLFGIAGMDASLADLDRLGVRRVSTGSGLARIAYSAALTAADALLKHQPVPNPSGTLSYAEFNRRLRDLPPVSRP